MVAASLRFLQFFAKGFEPTEELVEIVSRVESKHPQVQFEQATLLTSLASESTQLPKQLLRRLLDSPSWIVTRTTYGLIGQLHEEPLRKELVQRYKETDDERERLILLEALGEWLEPEEAQLFEEEMLATKNQKIRQVTLNVLIENLDCPGVKS